MTMARQQKQPTWSVHYCYKIRFTTTKLQNVVSTQQDQTSNSENDVSRIHVKAVEPEHANSIGAIIG